MYTNEKLEGKRMKLLNMVPMWVIIIVAVLVVITVFMMVVTYLKHRNLEQIRTDVYQLILIAEHMYQESGQGKQKMKWVVSQARKLLPEWMRKLVSEDNLMEIIQVWFDGIKDLLDDGKMNGTGKEAGAQGEGE